jgi:hypothetical protein
MSTIRPIAALGLLFALVAVPARAVDGVVEINSARVVAGGITADDTPGYPVTISASGSYRLTGSLRELSAEPTVNTPVIEITADDVTLDLNGFEILCAHCVSLTCRPCSSGTADGIHAASRQNTAILNGTIRDMPRHGIFLDGCEGAYIDRVRAVGNGSDGISPGTYCLVRSSMATGNGGVGINGGSYCNVAENTAEGNDGVGISQARGLVYQNVVASNGGIGVNASNGTAVIGNTIRSNTGLGLSAATGSVGYAENALSGNNGSNPEISGGTNMGGNSCETAVCAGNP